MRALITIAVLTCALAAALCPSVARAQGLSAEEAQSLRDEIRRLTPAVAPAVVAPAVVTPVVAAPPAAPAKSISAQVTAPAEKEIELRDNILQTIGLPKPEVGGFRFTGFFVGSANFSTQTQIVPEFAGGAQAQSQPGSLNFRFARRFFVREVRLSDKEKAAIKQASGWTPEEDFYRFYVGRDDQGRMVGSLVFIGDATIHGSVRVATAFGPDGKVRGASVVELTEETYPWVKPLIDEQFTQDWVGHDSQSRFALSDRLARVRNNSMTQFYGEVVANLVRRAALLYEYGMRPSGSAMLSAKY